MWGSWSRVEEFEPENFTLKCCYIYGPNTTRKTNMCTQRLSMWYQSMTNFGKITEPGPPKSGEENNKTSYSLTHPCCLSKISLWMETAEKVTINRVKLKPPDLTNTEGVSHPSWLITRRWGCAWTWRRTCLSSLHMDSCSLDMHYL